MKLDPLESKFKSFGFDVFVSNGHDIDDIMNNYDLMVNLINPPVLLLIQLKVRALVLWKINLTGIIESII